MKIAIGCDHGAFELKNELVSFLKNNGIEVIDKGTFSTESVGYPVYAFAVAEDVAQGIVDKGVVLCSTGIGVSIAANKVKGIRCALVHDLASASLTRKHNNSNVLAMGAKIIDVNKAKEILKIWLETEYEGGRHERRIGQISSYEENR